MRLTRSRRAAISLLRDGFTCIHICSRGATGLAGLWASEKYVMDRPGVARAPGFESWPCDCCLP
jgi:hypothetical protein